MTGRITPAPAEWEEEGGEAAITRSGAGWAADRSASEMKGLAVASGGEGLLRREDGNTSLTTTRSTWSSPRERRTCRRRDRETRQGEADLYRGWVEGSTEECEEAPVGLHLVL